jgi:hypothetical protein
VKDHEDRKYIIMFYDKLEPVLEVLDQFGATPAEAIAEVTPQFNVVSG